MTTKFQYLDWTTGEMEHLKFLRICLKEQLIRYNRINLNSALKENIAIFVS